MTESGGDVSSRYTAPLYFSLGEFMRLVHESADGPRRTLSDPGHVREADFVVRVVVCIWVWYFFLFSSYIYIYFNIFKFSDFCFVLWPLGCEIYFLKISGEHLLRGCWRMPWFAPRPFSMVPRQLV